MMPSTLHPSHADLEALVPVGIWKHFKGGRYHVLGYVYDSSCDDLRCPEILYQNLTSGRIWRRAVYGPEGFLTPKLLLDGTEVPRFTFLEAPKASCYILDDNGDY